MQGGASEIVRDKWTSASKSKNWWVGRTVFKLHHFAEQTDQGVDPVPMRELTRKERKQLGREIPWREILKRGPEVIGAFCQALRQEEAQFKK